MQEYTISISQQKKNSNKYFDKIHFDLKLISLMHNGGTLIVNMQLNQLTKFQKMDSSKYM